jgi:hypothetical protein
MLVILIKCPHSGKEHKAPMPSSGRKMAMSCPHCNKIMFKKQDSCCVFCSYGIIKCPVEQEKGNFINIVQVYLTCTLFFTFSAKGLAGLKTGV